MKKSTLFAILIIALFALGVRAARAQDTPPPRVTLEPVIPPPIDEPHIPPPPFDTTPECFDCLPPMPPVWNMSGLEIPYQRVNVTIENQVAVTHVEQLFRNPTGHLMEGTYFFPLPPGAAVSQLTMWVNGAPIEAKILPAAEARGIYDAIVRQLRDPALLEYVGADAIQANVFPIPPGDERRVEIEYTHLLTADNGTFRYVYPQSAGLYTDTPLDEQSIRVELRSTEAIRTLYSPSHRVAVDRPNDFSAVVGYEDANVLPGGDATSPDFELYYTVSPEDIGLTLLSYKEPDEDGFFLLLVAPGLETRQVVAKDVIIVLDTSGSMEGEKMAQAQEAAAYVISHLNPEDRFALVTFSTGVSLYEPQLLPAGAPGNYRQYIDSLAAVGGTNISGALLEAANLVGERPTTILFLTDGLATEGITDTPLLLETVGAALPDNVRVFAFGVGDDVDTTLLDTLAAEQRGATTYVRPGQAVDEAVSAFYAKIGSPVLTDLLLDLGGIRADQVYPTTLPDLFAGTQLVVAGRYRQGGPATITLSGNADGQRQSFTFADQTFRDTGGEAFIPRLWATRAIGHLMQQIRLGGENPELVQSIVNLSTRYGIITPYTSFLIEEDDIVAQSGELSMEASNSLAAPAAVSGAEAVDRAAVEGQLAAAEAPMPLATMAVTDGGGQAVAQTLVQTAGSRTFFLRDGVWVDSAYDTATEPRLIPFASDAYFELLTARPELGEALALGEEMLLVVEGEAVRISSGGGEAQTTDTPTASDAVAQTGTDTPPATDEQPAGMTSVGLQGCASALILPLLVMAGWGVSRRRGRATN